jgi:hypothetical protein
MIVTFVSLYSEVSVKKNYKSQLEHMVGHTVHNRVIAFYTTNAGGSTWSNTRYDKCADTLSTTTSLFTNGKGGEGGNIRSRSHDKLVYLPIYLVSRYPDLHCKGKQVSCWMSECASGARFRRECKQV